MQPVWITEGAARPFYARTRAKIAERRFPRWRRSAAWDSLIFTSTGKRWGINVLDPGWTDYNKLVQFVTFDVTSLLREGENVLAAEVGNGWYHLDEEGYVSHFPNSRPRTPIPTGPSGPVWCWRRR